jgi:hypothetical protein
MQVADIDFNIVANANMQYIDKKCNDFTTFFNGKYLQRMIDTLNCDTIKMFTDATPTHTVKFTDNRDIILMCPLMLHDH